MLKNHDRQEQKAAPGAREQLIENLAKGKSFPKICFELRRKLRPHANGIPVQVLFVRPTEEEFDLRMLEEAFALANQIELWKSFSVDLRSYPMKDDISRTRHLVTFKVASTR